MDRETVKDRIKAKKSERSPASDVVVDGDRPEKAAHNAITTLAAKLTAMGEPGSMHANLTLPVDVLMENPEVFTAYDAKHVQTLTKMVRSGERLLPIIVALVSDADSKPTFLVVDGHHRLAAHKAHGRKEIIADVYIGISNAAAAELSAKIHTHRRKAAPWDMLAAVKNNQHMTVAELSELLMVKESYVYQMQRVVKRCPESLQHEFRTKPKIYTWAVMRHIGEKLEKDTTDANAVAAAETILAKLLEERATKKATKKAVAAKRQNALSPDTASAYFLKSLVAGGIDEKTAQNIVASLDAARKSLAGFGIGRDVIRDAYGILFKFSI